MRRVVLCPVEASMAAFLRRCCGPAKPSSVAATSQNAMSLSLLPCTTTHLLLPALLRTNSGGSGRGSILGQACGQRCHGSHKRWHGHFVAPTNMGLQSNLVGTCKANQAHNINSPSFLVNVSVQYIHQLPIPILQEKDREIGGAWRWYGVFFLFSSCSLPSLNPSFISCWVHEADTAD